MRSLVAASLATLLLFASTGRAAEQAPVNPEISDVHLVAVPEPGTVASIVGGVAILVGWRRWRRLGGSH